MTIILSASILVIAVVAVAISFWLRTPKTYAQIVGYTAGEDPSITVRALINQGDTIGETSADEEADRVTISVEVRPFEGPGTHVPRPHDITMDLDSPVTGRSVIDAGTGKEVPRLND